MIIDFEDLEWKPLAARAQTTLFERNESPYKNLIELIPNLDYSVCREIINDLHTF